MHLRPDAGPAGPPRLEPFLDELAEEERERTHIAGRAEEERREGLTVSDPAALGLDRRGRQVRPRGVARQQIADAGPVVRKQALSVRDARSDQGRIGGIARCHQVFAVSLIPAEGWDPIVVAVQDPGLAARRHRRQDRLPARQLVAAVADHAGHRVDRAGAHPAGQDRMGEAIDLDDHQAWLVRMASRSLDHQPLDQRAVIRAAAVDPEDRRQDRVDDRVDERADQRGPEAVHVDAGGPLGHHDERDHLEDEHEDADQDQRDRGRQREDNRPDGGVEQRDQDDRHHRVLRTIDGHPRQHPGGGQERDRRHDQGDHESLEQSGTSALPFPENPQLRRVEVCQSADHRGTPLSIVTNAVGTG